MLRGMLGWRNPFWGWEGAAGMGEQRGVARNMCPGMWVQQKLGELCYEVLPCVVTALLHVCAGGENARPTYCLPHFWPWRLPGTRWTES